MDIRVFISLRQHVQTGPGVPPSLLPNKILADSFIRGYIGRDVWIKSYQHLVSRLGMNVALLSASHS
jgi:hypothetical protein